MPSAIQKGKQLKGAPEMSSSSHRILSSHEEIKEWAEERGAFPASVKGTGSENDAGLIRLVFPGYSGKTSLEKIGWDAFFAKVDEIDLVLLVRDETADGQKSHFNKLVNRATTGGSRKAA